MAPSTETKNNKRTTKHDDKLVFSVAQTEELVSEKKIAERLYGMMVKSLGIKMTEEDEKLKIMIPNSVQPLLPEFGKMVFDDLPDSLPLMRDIEHDNNLVLGASPPNPLPYRVIISESR